MDPLLTRVVDLLLAASFFVVAARLAGDGGVAGYLSAALQAMVAVAFLVRTAERRAARWSALAAAAPSLLLAAVTLRAAGTEAFAGPSLVLAAIGAAVSLGAMLSLGRSFAVLPAVRVLKTRGLYALVRHPLYLGELLVFAAAARCLSWWGLASAVVLAPLLAWRIHQEELLLRDEPGWAEWAARVRYRLVPGVW